ncbi:MAG TPA: 1,2-phenylacetyl-CoA epoxidase subunit PaaD [Gemmatimonadaceae bacterium]|nr:1,2-phenylacetyl-CoA epoxidase subunit PaaD [Gemmatimonadaceae bacterium]
MSAPLTRDDVFAILDEVKDPEVPVLSVVELGIVRDVVVDGAAVTVTITPTYSGCPAMRVIEADITAALETRGLSPVRLETVYAPAWTTEWMSAAAKQKLAAYGIAPPGRAVADSLVRLTRAPAAERVLCPYCGSKDTEMRSEFGSTACKAIMYCRGCQQPFELFKAI